MMEIIYKGRGEGKTSELIKHSAKTGAVIVTPNIRGISHIKEMAKEMGYDIPNPIAYTQLSNNTKNILIDNADMLLKIIFPQYIEAISLNKEEKER